MSRCSQIAIRTNRFVGISADYRRRRRTKRFLSSSSSDKAAKEAGAAEQAKLKWTEQKEAPNWLKRMEPTKGGTLPTLKEGVVIAVVGVAGFYAWFVEPPKSVD